MIASENTKSRSSYRIGFKKIRRNGRGRQSEYLEAGGSRNTTIGPVYPEKSKTERGSEGPGMALLARAHTDIWL